MKQQLQNRSTNNIVQQSSLNKGHEYSNQSQLRKNSKNNHNSHVRYRNPQKKTEENEDMAKYHDNLIISSHSK
jgi:hypothetical protein